MAASLRRGRIGWLSLLVALVGIIGRPPSASAVGWPPSTGLLVSEVVTGGASASDEFVELYNASSSDLELGGLELVYITSSGATVTRKMTWTALTLPAHRHLLIANSAGVYAAAADGTYSGGLSATGGSLVLRTLGGTVIDSLSWGDAASSFVEAPAGSAPPAGSSLERRPGGTAGNASDTNDNLVDSLVNPGPVTQGLAASPMPPLPPTPSPTPICSWVAPATPSATASPTSTVWPLPTPGSTPSPIPMQSPTAISVARALPVGSVVTLSGQLTVATGVIDGGRSTYMDDGTGGAALYLDTADWPTLVAGTVVQATGVLEELHGETTLTLPSVSDLVVSADGVRPSPLWAATGLACEAFESRLVAVQGWVASGLTPVSGGHGAVVDDGTGPLNVVVPLPVEVAADDLEPGTLIELVGVLSQVEQTADGYGRYALILTSAADVLVLERSASPTPTPTTTPTWIPTVFPAPTSSATSTATPSPSPSATPVLVAEPIVDARQRPLGTRVLVRGAVTVEAGRVLGDTVIGIEDDSGGIYVRLPDGAPSVARGQELEVGGVLAAPYGNLEIRPSATDVRLLGPGVVPAPRTMAAADLGEATEGLLARLSVTIDSVETGSSGSLTLLVHDDSGATRVFFHAPIGASPASFRAGQRLAAVGLVGDRLGLYRLWPRDLSDIAVVGNPPTATPRPSGTGTTATASPRPSATPQAAISIADALRQAGATMTLSGVVTTRPGLLDADAQRVTLQDGSGAILVRLPGDVGTQVGRRLSVTGEIGTYYGAPQLAATRAVDQGAAQPDATVIRSAPVSRALEWRLVTISGSVQSVHRDGDSWRAELTLPGGGVPIVGLERAGIPSSALEAGRSATITGIVKRAYPTASDQRLAIVPRGTADIRPGAAQSTGGPASATPNPGISAPSTGSAGQQAGVSPPAGPSSPRGEDVALADLAAHEGAPVRAGGQVSSIYGTLVVLVDSSGSATLQLVGRAAPLAETFAPGDLVNATGMVIITAAGPRLIVDDPAAVTRLHAPRTSAVYATQSAEPVSPQHPPLGHQPALSQSAATAPLMVVAAISGLALVLVIGALIMRTGGLNRLVRAAHDRSARRRRI